MGVILQSTKGGQAKGTIFLTGGPGAGKTLLACKLLAYLVGTPDGSSLMLLDFPEEEGTSTVSDMDIKYAVMKSLDDVDSMYGLAVKHKPAGIVIDGLPAAWKMFLYSRFPSGDLPGDMGASWRRLGFDLTGMITRFKMLPSVKWLCATSLVWADMDDITGQDKRLQATLPGQLKGNIYGFFSYAFNIKLMEAEGKPVRVLETRPTAKVVAKVRTPVGMQPPSSILYDVGSPTIGIEYLAAKLGLRALATTTPTKEEK